MGVTLRKATNVNNFIFSKLISGLSLQSWQKIHTWGSLLVPLDPVKVKDLT